jgi:prevent-host-death family protein
MRKISIRELHLHTGKWVRKAAESQPVIVLDRGRPTARLMPLEEASPISFRDRKLVKGFATLPAVETDSGRFLEEDRR